MENNKKITGVLEDLNEHFITNCFFISDSYGELKQAYNESVKYLKGVESLKEHKKHPMKVTMTNGTNLLFCKHDGLVGVVAARVVLLGRQYSTEQVMLAKTRLRAKDNFDDDLIYIY